MVTNSHVVDIKGEITIEYPDGSVIPAQIYSNDIKSDIALLIVDDVKIKALPLISTIDLEITDEVYSIGYQLNLEGDATVTKGILSAKRVASGIEFLQTDSAVNPGGSGGPVINDKGELLGMISLASENATLSFAISSDTLELYIDKLIKAPEITYITNKREGNALSAVLKEVNYSSTDIYDEDKYFKSDEKKDNDGEKGEHNNQNDNEKPSTQQPPTPKKDYSITETDQTSRINKNKPLSSNVNYYFNIGKDLTNCKLDTSKVNLEVGGEYEISVTCDQNKATRILTNYAPIPPNQVAIPTINMDETKNNVTSFEQVKGYWYYPGYRDACIGYLFEVDSYHFFGQVFDANANRLSYNTGGSSVYYTFEEIMAQQKLWVEGNWLVVTYNGHTMYFTRTPGTGVYNENHLDDNGLCK